MFPGQYLLKRSLMKNFIFCAVSLVFYVTSSNIHFNKNNHLNHIFQQHLIPTWFFLPSGEHTTWTAL